MFTTKYAERLFSFAKEPLHRGERTNVLDEVDYLKPRNFSSKRMHIVPKVPFSKVLIEIADGKIKISSFDKEYFCRTRLACHLCLSDT